MWLNGQEWMMNCLNVFVDEILEVLDGFLGYDIKFEVRTLILRLEFIV
jgi:hypothetical protein